MGRIFVGLCQVGAWGCFDEFNRLEERMLSAVSQQVQCIQEALREHSNPNSEKSDHSWHPPPQHTHTHSLRHSNREREAWPAF